MQWNKDDGFTSSFQKLIILHLPRFEELSLSQFKLYIETLKKITQFFVCRNCQKTILIQSASGNFLNILHMLRVYTGLRKLSKTNVYDLDLKILIHLYW